MPLIRSSSKRALSSNIRELYLSNPDRPLKQDVAIAEKEKRKAARGGR